MLPKTRHNDKKLKVTVRLYRTVAFLFLSLFLFAYHPHSFTSATGTGVESSSAQDEFGIQEVGENIAVPVSANSDIRVLIVRIINVALGFLGLVAVLVILYAGYLWMTSNGNEETVAQAKKMLINAAIGLLIILSAFAITSFILRKLTDAINGGGAGAGGSPVVQTYTFSGSLGSVIKDHYPRRDQQEVPRNTSIVVTFGVPVNPATIIENLNRTCWNAELSGPTTVCKTTSGSDVGPTTPFDQIANPYYGDCVDLNNDSAISSIEECDRLMSQNVIIDQNSSFEQNIENHSGIASAALTTYDSDRQAFTFVFRPHEYLGSPTEDIEYRVHLTTALTRSDTNRGVFENQFSEGYSWKFTTGNKLDLDPPHVVDVYPQANLTVPRNSILQVTFSEPIDPTAVDSVVSDASTSTGFFSTALNYSVDNIRKIAPGSWRLSNGYTTLEFTSSQACGVNSCGEAMFCLPVSCVGDACTNQYEVVLRTGEWTRNASSPFESVPFSGIYDLAFNGLDNESDNESSQHLIKPDSNVTPFIRDIEKAPDNYWWNFQVANTIDRLAPYVEEIFPGVDAEDISGSSNVYIQFSDRMWQKTLQDLSLEEYPNNVCADSALPVNERANPNSCKRLDTLWYRVGAITQNEKTKATFEHREFGPNNLDLYYIPQVPSTVKSVTQNCVYPGIGPWEGRSAPFNTPSSCKLTYDPEGNVTTAIGCVGVTQEPSEDTGCVYTLGVGQPTSDSGNPIFRSGNVEECVTRVHSESPSTY